MLSVFCYNPGDTGTQCNIEKHYNFSHIIIALFLYYVLYKTRAECHSRTNSSPGAYVQC